MSDVYDTSDIFASYRVKKPGQQANLDYGPSTAPPSDAGWSTGPAGSSAAYVEPTRPPRMGEAGGTDWTKILAERARRIGAANQADQQMPTMNGVPYTPEMQNQWGGYGGVAGGVALPGGYTTGPFPGAVNGGAGGAAPGAGGVPGAGVAPAAWGGLPQWQAPAAMQVAEAPQGPVMDPASMQTYLDTKRRMMALLAGGQHAEAQQLVAGLRGY